MKSSFFFKIKSTFTSTYFWFFGILPIILFLLFFFNPYFLSIKLSYPPKEKNIENANELNKSTETLLLPVLAPLDIVAYNKKLDDLANNPPPVISEIEKNEKDNNLVISSPEDKTILEHDNNLSDDNIVAEEIEPNLWPVKTVYPNAGAILPFNRIIAYYGNLYSRNMGILGQYSENEMLRRLDIEIQKWKIADPETPVIPALHYIAVVAQGSAGQDGKYRTRMPDEEIDKVIKMAAKIDALVFLDVQVGFSNLQTEIPLLEKYLKMPQIHLGIDPEFSMKNGIKPGKVVGTLDATDINFTADYLAKIVRENNLTPKILVVHRYTQKMVTNYQDIKPLPEVQFVMHMDGWGESSKKVGTYQQFIYKEPVQFTGFKLFYKNDIQTEDAVMTPEELLKLRPIPIYIQYQ